MGIARQYRIVNPEATDSEVQEAADADWGNEGVFQTALKTNRTATANTVLGAVRARHNDIQKIEATLIQLNQLMEDLATAVVLQDEPIQQTEQHTENVKKDTEAGNVSVLSFSQMDLSPITIGTIPTRVEGELWAEDRYFVPFWSGPGHVYALTLCAAEDIPVAPLQKGDVVPGEPVSGAGPYALQNFHVEIHREDVVAHEHVSGEGDDLSPQPIAKKDLLVPSPIPSYQVDEESGSPSTDDEDDQE